MSIPLLIPVTESPIYGQIFRLFLCLYTVNRSSLITYAEKRTRTIFPSCSMFNIKLNSRWTGRFGIKYNDLITIQIKSLHIRTTAFDWKTMDSSSSNEFFALFSVQYFLLLSTCMDTPWLSHICTGSCGELLILDRQLALVLFTWENNDLPFCSWGSEEESG